MTKESQKPKLTKKNVFIGAGLFVVILAFAIPWLTPDGSEQYSGVKKQAAQKAISMANDSVRGINRVGSLTTLKFYAEDVRPVADEQRRCTDSPEDIGYYDVLVSHRTFFGISVGREEEFHGCYIGR